MLMDCELRSWCIVGKDPEGVKLPYKKLNNINHNPEGVEFLKKHCRAQGMPCAYEDSGKPIFACEEPTATHWQISKLAN